MHEAIGIAFSAILSKSMLRSSSWTTIPNYIEFSTVECFLSAKNDWRWKESMMSRERVVQLLGAWNGSKNNGLFIIAYYVLQLRPAFICNDCTYINVISLSLFSCPAFAWICIYFDVVWNNSACNKLCKFVKQDVCAPWLLRTQMHNGLCTG